MQLKTKFICLLAGLLLGGVALHAQSGFVKSLRFEDFGDFRRMEVYTSEMPTYKLRPDFAGNSLIIEMDLPSDNRLAAPANSPAKIEILRTDNSSKFIVTLPYPFRYESFYFKPANKLIIDFYRGARQETTTAVKSEPKQIAQPESTPESSIPASASPYLSGLRSLQAGDTTAATAHFEAAINRNPDHHRAHMQLGLIYAIQHRNDSARTHFNEARKDIELRFTVDLQLEQLNAPAEPAQKQNPAQPENKAVVMTEIPQDEPAKSQVAKVPFWGHIEFPDILSTYTKTNTLKVVSGALAVLFLIVSVIFYRHQVKRSSKPKKDQVSRILSLLQKNQLYNNHHPKENAPANSAKQKAEETPAANRIDLYDEVDMMPKPIEGEEPVPNRRNVEQFMNNIEMPGSRLRDIQRPMNENNVTPVSHSRLTPAALASRSSILELALEGYSVRQIAERIEIGTGEVELVLGLRRTSSRVTAPSQQDEQREKSNLRIDFSY